MEKVEAWVRDQKKAPASFSEALVSPSIYPYVIYRLRYLVFNHFFNVIPHVVEFSLLYSVLNVRNFSFLILLRTIFAGIKSIWWGALEVLRSRVRYWYRKKQNERLKLEINCWLIFSLILALFPIIIGLYYVTVFWNHSVGKQLILINGFVFLLCFECAVAIIKQTFHSGIYALHRIRYPLIVLLFPSIIHFLLLVILWPFLNIYGLLISYAITSAVSFAIHFYYPYLQYLLYCLLPQTFPSRKRIILFFKTLISLELVLAGLANLSINIENLLIWVIFYKSYTSGNSEYYQLFLLFYLVNPLVRFCSEWARLFYFDFKKNNIMTSEFFKKFHSQLFVSSTIIGLVFWLIAEALLIGYFNQYIYFFSLFMLIFFVLKSNISYMQIYAFCFGYYARTIFSAFFILAAFFITFLLPNANLVQVGVLLFFMAMSLLYINRVNASIVVDSRKILLPFHQWIYLLSKMTSPVRLSKIRLNKNLFRGKNGSFIKILSAKLKKSGKFTSLNSEYIIFYEKMVENDRGIDDRWLAEHGAGIVVSHALSKVASNGRQAIQQAYHQGLFSMGNQNLDYGDKSFSVKKLIAHFETKIPYGFYIDKTGHDLSNMHEKVDYRKIFQQAKYYLKYPLGVQQFHYSVSIVHDENSIPILFVIPVAYENVIDITTWHKLIYWNLIFNYMNTETEMERNENL